MLYEAKLVLAPLFAVSVISSNLLASMPEALRITLDVAALSVLLAGFLVLGRLRAQAAAAEGAARAWHEERDAMADKADRLQEDLLHEREQISALRTLNAELQQRPTLDALAMQIEQLRKAVHEVAERLPAITDR